MTCNYCLGGPGSAKTERISDVATLHPTWRVISVGTALWRYLEDRYPDGLGETTKHFGDEMQEDEDITANMIKNVMRKGEMVPQVISVSCLENTQQLQFYDRVPFWTW